MNPLYIYAVLNKMMVNRHIYHPHLTDANTIRNYISLREGLTRDITFIERKMQGRGFMPYNSQHMFRHHFMGTITDEFENNLRNGLDHNAAIQHPDMQTWLFLWKKYDILTFDELSITSLQIAHEEVSVHIPYEGPTNLDMFRDYLLNFMGNQDALQFCDLIIQYAAGF